MDSIYDGWEMVWKRPANAFKGDGNVSSWHLVITNIGSCIDERWPRGIQCHGVDFSKGRHVSQSEPYAVRNSKSKIGCRLKYARRGRVERDLNRISRIVFKGYKVDRII